MNKQTALFISAGGGIVIFLAIFFVLSSQNNTKNVDTTSTNTTASQVKVDSVNTAGTNTQATTSTTSTVNTATSGTTATAVTNKYKDGTYSTTASYKTPEDTEKVGVKITLQNDTISAVDVTVLAVDQESVMYQNRFKSGISSVVVGKKLDSTSVGKVNGSSLTGIGFNAALDAIKTTAKA